MKTINVIEIKHVKTINQEYRENYITQFKRKDEYINDPRNLFSPFQPEMEIIKYDIVTFIRKHNGKMIETHYAIPIDETMGNIPFLQEILNHKIKNFRMRESRCNRIEKRNSFLENENDFLRSTIKKLTSSKFINFLSTFFIKK